MNGDLAAGGVRIRPALEADLPGIDALVAAAYGRYVARIGRPPGPMLDDYGRHVRDAAAWVAACGTGVVGLLVLRPEPDALLLDNVAVSPAWQGRGIGRALMAFAEDEARRRGYGRLILYTHEQMSENIAMYRALGWRETGRGEQSGYRRVFFEKSL